jgi:hypothetical protein
VLDHEARDGSRNAMWIAGIAAPNAAPPVAEGHLGKFQSATSEQRRVRLVGRLPMQPDLGSARFDLAQKLKPS